MYCLTCGTRLQNNPKTIVTYLAEKTGTLCDSEKVCFSRYKSHLHVLKHSQSESIDGELKGLIQGIKCTIISPQHIKNVEDDINRAMKITTVYVEEVLLEQEGLLLPDVHNYFLQQCLPTSAEPTARWVLSNLTASLTHHLSYVCKIRKCGTLLYRSNGSINKRLTQAIQTSSWHSW